MSVANIISLQCDVVKPDTFYPSVKVVFVHTEFRAIFSLKISETNDLLIYSSFFKFNIAPLYDTTKAIYISASEETVVK